MKHTLQIIFVAIVSLFMATACSVTSSPRSTAKHFYKSIEKGDFDKALSFTTLEAEAGDEEDLEHTTVVAQITFNDGSSQEEYCDLIQQDGKWAIDVSLDSK